MWNESSASGDDLGRLIFHRHLLKDKPTEGVTQEKTTETLQIVWAEARPAYLRLRPAPLAAKTSGIALKLAGGARARHLHAYWRPGYYAPTELREARLSR